MKKYILCIVLVTVCTMFCPIRANAEENNVSKKGLQIDYGMLSDVEDLGISEAFLNINFERILSLQPTDYSYNYNGSTYYFNSRVLNDYDMMIRHLTDKGVRVTAAFLNSYESGYEDLIYPGVSYRSETVNYAFNTATQKGRNTIVAVCHFIAERYDGEEFGLISNYVIGNEVNDNGQYNYIGPMEIEKYVQNYYDTYKIFYDAIKSKNTTANLYIPFEHRWATENTLTDYAARDFISIFNSLAKQDGDIDWNIAFHAYSYPLSNANVLLDGQPSVDATGRVTYGDEVLDTENSPLITMKNIHVLTDYLQREEFRNTDGEVCSIILSEQGYTSDSNVTGKNEILQAASVAYAYYVAEMNPYIDAFILNGHTDNYIENEYLKFGLWNSDNGYATTTKKVYNMYKYIDTTYSLEVTNFALETLGAYSWEEVIDKFDPDKISSFKSIENGSIYSVNTLDGLNDVVVLSAGMKDYWEPGYNVHALSSFDHFGNYFPKYTAVADGNANYLTAQSVEHKFETIQDFSSYPYLGFSIGFVPKNRYDLDDELVVRVRLYSGGNIFDANCLVNANEESNLFVDLSKWKYRDAVDSVAIWIRKNNEQKAFDGVFTVYEFSKVADLGEKQKEGTVWKTEPNIIAAESFYPTMYGGVEYGDVYNPEYYAENNPDVVSVIGHSPVLLIEHFVKNGMLEGRQASVAFNLDAYKKYNPDLNEAYGNNNREYYLHYIEWGKDEGRTAQYETTLGGIAEQYAAIFDSTFYFENNEDIASAVGNDEAALLEHFLNFGMLEGRQACEKFNVHFYMSNYEDLRNVYGEDLPNYYWHYLNHGKAEGRVATESSQTVLDGIDYAFVFNASYYEKNNRDVSSVFGNDSQTLLKHFVNHGMREGRKGNEEFNVTTYMNNYEDLRLAYGMEDYIPYYMHYINCGKIEGREAKVLLTITTPEISYIDVFDAAYYYANNEDVALKFGSDEKKLLEHFVNCGMTEGRQASKEFNVYVYMDNNPDIKAAYEDDLEKYYYHYIQYGKNEGRNAS